MTVARHSRPPEVAELSIEEIAARYVRHYRDCVPDWEAFEDAKVDGYRRAQHHFIGGGGSGKHDNPDAIPQRSFTLSIMYVEPGESNAAHTHEVEEVFFRPPGNAHGISRGGRQGPARNHGLRQRGPLRTPQRTPERDVKGRRPL